MRNASVLAVAALLLGIAMPSQPAQGQAGEPFVWIAAGDSYTAGEGIGDDATHCQTSLFAYPLRAARMLGTKEVAARQIDPDNGLAYLQAWRDSTEVQNWTIGEALEEAERRRNTWPEDALSIASRDGGTRLVTTRNDRLRFLDLVNWTGGVDIDQRWVACSGARVEDLFTQQPGTTRGGQLSSQPRESADLITMSIGGNDVGFADVIQDCLGSNLLVQVFAVVGSAAGKSSTDCSITRTEAFDRMSNLMDPRSSCRTSRHAVDDDEKYRCSLKADIPDTWGGPTIGLVDAYVEATSYLKPGGTLLIVGYPLFYPKGWSAECEVMEADDTVLLNDLSSTFDRLLGDAVEIADRLTPSRSVEYMSVIDLFADHELCGDDRDWLNSNKFDPSFGKNWTSDAYHPTNSGHLGMARALKPLVEDLIDARTRGVAGPIFVDITALNPDAAMWEEVDVSTLELQVTRMYLDLFGEGVFLQELGVTDPTIYLSAAVEPHNGDYGDLTSRYFVDLWGQLPNDKFFHDHFAVYSQSLPAEAGVDAIGVVNGAVPYDGEWVTNVFIEEDREYIEEGQKRAPRMVWDGCLGDLSDENVEVVDC